MTVSEPMGGDTGMTSLAGLSGELDNVQQQGVGGGWAERWSKQGQKERSGRKESEGAPSRQAAQVVAYGSGNLAQVYFDLYPRRILLSELDAAYPGMVDALVQHEGIGFVRGYEDDGHARGPGQERAAQSAHRRGDRRSIRCVPYGDVALPGAGRCGG